MQNTSVAFGFLTNLKFELKALLAFSFSDAFRDGKERNRSEIYWTYDFTQIFKVTVDMN